MNHGTAVPPHPTASAWLNRVQALLAKAESTDFPDEAESLLAKAQDLMARHAISEAMVAAERARSGGAPDPVGSVRVVVEAPYASAKRVLLGAVANANGCRCVYLGQDENGRPCQVFGHESDLAKVETLFASLSVQAARSMLAATVPPGDTPRRFRHAFLLAYANRIGQRLWEAGEAARSQAEAESGGGGSLGLVLRDRKAAVDHALNEAFPRTRTARTSATSGAGWRSGRSAAERAGLGQRGLGRAGRALGAG
ncbi:MAG: DUF2786 domain-containing protein [Acidimicrobiales bacterium]|nr:DUF2786 domain-containing protein [Acidimicrobiales bacterium]